MPLAGQQQANPMAEASAHLDAGRYSQAIEILKALAEKQPDDYAVQFNMALAYTLAGNDAEAIAGFRKVLKLKDDLYEARLNLGQLLVKTGEYKEAAAALEQCLQKKPNDGKAAYLLGRAWAGAEDWKKAAEWLEKASELNPGDTAAAMELAAIYEKAHMPEKAAAVYSRFPDDPAAQERRGLILMQAGDPESAIVSLEAARAKSPTPGLLYALSTAYLRNKQPEKAIPVAEKLVEAEPSNAEMRLFYGRLLRDQKRYEEASKQFLAAVKIKPESGEAWNELTAMLILLKQYEPALSALDRAKALNGETPAYYYFRATMFDAMNQPKPALENYRKFLSMSEGKHPDEEFKARHRSKALEKAVNR